MELTIKTKFNIGDKVYVVDHYYELYARKTPGVITSVWVCSNTRHTIIRYEVKFDGNTEEVPESWVFSSYEECAKWCDEHN